MKPADKERLAKCRPTLLRSLDVDSLLPILVKAKIFSSKEQKDIENDVRERQRIVMFLDKLEKKKTDQYTQFLDLLADRDPHTYLMLTDDDFEGNPSDLHESLGDDVSRLERVREYLADEIDAASVLPALKPGLLTEGEKHTIMRQQERKQRTEALVDILDAKGPDSWDVLVEALSDTHPHVYLALTGQDDLDDGDDDDDWY